MTNIWAYLIPIIITLALNLVVLVVTYLINRKKQASDVVKTNADAKKAEAEADKLGAEKEEIYAKLWKELYAELRTNYDEIESRLSALEKSKEELEMLFEKERSTRIRLQRVIEGIQLWFIRNQKKMEEACIEPFPPVQLS
jgi:ABC-type nitrate/sulfonate/bicarbonate transport system substrate-binding protein